MKENKNPHFVLILFCMIYPTKRYIHLIIKETLFRLVYLYSLSDFFFSPFFFWFCLTLSCRRLGRLKLPSHSPCSHICLYWPSAKSLGLINGVQTSWLGHFDFQNLELASLFLFKLNAKRGLRHLCQRLHPAPPNRDKFYFILFFFFF